MGGFVLLLVKEEEEEERRKSCEGIMSSANVQGDLESARFSPAVKLGLHNVFGVHSQTVWSYFTCLSVTQKFIAVRRVGVAKVLRLPDWKADEVVELPLFHSDSAARTFPLDLPNKICPTLYLTH